MKQMTLEPAGADYPDVWLLVVDTGSETSIVNMISREELLVFSRYINERVGPTPKTDSHSANGDQLREIVSLLDEVPIPNSTTIAGAELVSLPQDWHVRRLNLLRALPDFSAEGVL